MAEVTATLTRNVTYDKNGVLNTTDAVYETVQLDNVEVITPVNSDDIATKAYVDGLIASVDTAAEISVAAAGFDGNLSPTENTVQKVAQKFDDYTPPSQNSEHGRQTYYTPYFVPNPVVSGGAAAESLSFVIPANGIADYEHIELSSLIFKHFTADGVATETRKISVKPAGGAAVLSQIASGLAMPNNVTYYSIMIPSFIIRIGTHLYFKNEGMFTNLSLTDASTSFYQTSDFIDLGEPDFTKELTISLEHTLSAASAGAIIKCMGAEVKHSKLS